MPIEYDQLDKNQANYVALSPISFLHRTADIYPEITSLVYGDSRSTWAETRQRCVKIASSLANRGVGRNDTVSIFAHNTPEMFESHFSIPMAGAVLNTINTRLDADTQATHTLTGTKPQVTGSIPVSGTAVDQIEDQSFT